MTAAGPPRDSAFDAVGYAFGVLAKPRFVWAPVLFTAITALPLLALPGPGTPPTSQQEFDAYVRSQLSTLLVAMVLGIVLGSVTTAFAYRLGEQYVEGRPSEPFAPGIVDLAWRFFLQALALGLLSILVALVCLFVLLVSDAILGPGLGILTTVIVVVVVVALIAVRLAMAPVLLLSGAGPIEAIEGSLRMTRDRRGQVFRWLAVSGLVTGITSAVIAGVIAATFTGLGLDVLGEFVGWVVVAPFQLVSAIVLLRLAAVLSGPALPPEPPVPVSWTTPA